MCTALANASGSQNLAGKLCKIKALALGFVFFSLPRYSCLNTRHFGRRFGWHAPACHQKQICGSDKAHIAIVFAVGRLRVVGRCAERVTPNMLSTSALMPVRRFDRVYCFIMQQTAAICAHRAAFLKRTQRATPTNVPPIVPHCRLCVERVGMSGNPGNINCWPYAPM